MPYTSPVTDRTLADIVAKNNKAYFNVADWERVYRNAQLTNSLSTITLNEVVSFPVITTPTITTIPDVEVFNSLLASIETLRVLVNIPSAQNSIKNDWIAGNDYPAPDSEDVNLWESTIDAIWVHFGGNALETCPTLTSNLTIPTGTDYIVIDCINPDAYEIIIEGTGELHVI